MLGSHSKAWKTDSSLVSNENFSKILLSSDWACCNLLVGVVLNVWFTMNKMCMKNHTLMWRKQAMIEWSWWSDLGEWPLTMLVDLVNSWLYFLMVTTTVIPIVPCCHNVKLCALATRVFRSQQAQGQVTWAKMAKNLPYSLCHSLKNLKPKTKKLFFHCRLKDLPNFLRVWAAL